MMDARKDSRFVSRETLDRLEAYKNLVLKWQKSINLIAPNTISDIWDRHFEDSLQLAECTPEPRTWIDLGSGAGFPGLVLAICLTEHNEGMVHLVESNNKKAAFLRSVISETGARAKVYPIRIEAAFKEIAFADAISARALAPLDQLLKFARPWVAANPQLECWFHKGVGYLEEVRIARGNWDFDLLEHQSRVKDGSVILQIQNPRKK